MENVTFERNWEELFFVRKSTKLKLFKSVYLSEVQETQTKYLSVRIFVTEKISVQKRGNRMNKQKMPILLFAKSLMSFVWCFEHIVYLSM